jgi:3-oxoacyl-[acyl-carrier protein] reductase
MKSAIVTGASKGIGRSIAQRLAADGFHAILCARDWALLDQAVEEIRAAGGQASAIALDLREPEAPGKLVDFAIAEAGSLAVVVSNAGATKRGEFSHLTDADFVDGFALKYFAGVRLARAAWPHLVASKGSIVFISGVGGWTPGRLFAIGGSVNAALFAFVKALAETGTRDGVQVNSVNPGTIRTGRFQQRLEADAQAAGTTTNVIEATFVRDQRIRRIGTPQDVANLVSFVVSEAGSLLHGALLDVDGGATKSI